MSLHKIPAGSGYDYLIRQVAVQDSTEKGPAVPADCLDSWQTTCLPRTAIRMETFPFVTIRGITSCQKSPHPTSRLPA